MALATRALQKRANGLSWRTDERGVEEFTRGYREVSACVSSWPAEVTLPIIQR
jgi:hypothetical protein